MLMSSKKEFDRAISALQNGEMIIIIDDRDRENEGDLVMAAEHATAEHVNFMVQYGKGLVCAPITQDKAKELHVGQMVSDNTDRHQTAFTVSVDASHGITTGISAQDRAYTLNVLADDNAMAEDFNKPGHIFPLRAADGGVIERPGHTEATVDILKIAGLKPAGVICEILKDDGTMARAKDLAEFAEKHDLPVITLQDIISYRKQHEKLIEHISSAKLPTEKGGHEIHVFESLVDGKTHTALVYGNIKDVEDVLVRVHSKCLTGDTFGSLRCDCGWQLDQSMKTIAEKGVGMVVYLDQEGRGIGLAEKIKAYHLQDEGMDTVEANHQLGHKTDVREYVTAAQIIDYFSPKSVHLMTSNPQKVDEIAQYGINITERVPLVAEKNEFNEAYLATKREKMGHLD